MESELLTLYRRKRENELSCKSAETAGRMLDRWAEVWKDLAVGEITALHVEAYRQSRADCVGASALNREGGELRRFFSFARGLGLAGGCPAGTWDRQKEVVGREYVVLTWKEEEALVAVLESDVLCRFVGLCVATGLRQGTIRRLTWEHVRGRTLFVPGPLMKQKNPVEIPLSSKAWEAIMPKRSIPLFPGLPSESVVRHTLKAAAPRAGISQDLTIHDLRRTWVARMRDAGADMSDVMSLGGWKEPTAMLKHYFGQVPEKRARQFLEAV